MEIAIIGGGASGMMAALAAKQQDKKSTVIIYEKNDRVGKKILMTGNGKCNFSNMDFRPEYFRSDSTKNLQCFFDAFGVQETLEFFEEQGLLVKNRNGYLYPASEQAATILDILRFACERAGVEIKTEAEVKRIVKKNDGFLVDAKVEKKHFDRVILACGSKAGPKNMTSGSGYLLAKSMGHQVIEPTPALVQLRCMEDFFKQIAGVRTECELTLFVDGKISQKERGELQLTDYGISGIPVFQFSRYAARALKERKSVKVSMNFLPDFSEESYEAFVHNRFEKKKGQSAECFFLGITNKKIMQLFLKLAGVKPDEKIEAGNREKWEKVFLLLRDFQVQVKESNPFENAQVSAGGICMDEVSENLESLLVPGLFFAGELLDVDGRCGGYNLQWAWTSGYLAGRAAFGVSNIVNGF